MSRTRRQHQVKQRDDAGDGEDESLGPNYPRWIMIGALVLVACLALRAWVISEKERGERAGEALRKEQDIKRRVKAAQDQSDREAFNFAR